MAFAQIKGVARDPKDYEVYQSPLYTDDDEKRMDIIGQNGNEGYHYEKVAEMDSADLPEDLVWVNKKESEPTIPLEEPKITRWARKAPK